MNDTFGLGYTVTKLEVSVSPQNDIAFKVTLYIPANEYECAIGGKFMLSVLFAFTATLINLSLQSPKFQ